MLKRDYLVKQFEEFGKVMAILLGLKRDKKFSELEELIQTATKKYTGTEIDFVEALDNASILKTLTEDKQLNDEQLKMLGDLLFEKAEFYSKYSLNALEKEASNCYKKSYLIYLFLKGHATLNYSLDMHYKLELLANMNL